MQCGLLAPSNSVHRIRCFQQRKPCSRASLPPIHYRHSILSPRPSTVPSAIPFESSITFLPVPDSGLGLTNVPFAGAFQAAPVFELSEGLETPLQLVYLLSLLGLLTVGAYLVVRQVLVRRELDEAAKALGERIRTGEANCEDYFELGVILTRKKLYTQATKNLEKAKKLWEGEETELAQVHNALGFCYFNMGKNEMAAEEYQKAVDLQPGYVTAWNNLGDVYEANKEWKQALKAYQEALSYAPNNKVALQRSEFMKDKVERLGLM